MSKFKPGVAARESVKDQIGTALERVEDGIPADNPIANGMRLASLQDPGGSDEWQLLACSIAGTVSSRLTSDIDARLRRSERRDAVQKALRNRLAYGAPAEGLVEAHNRAYLDEVMSRQLEEAASEMRKTAEEAGLSPEAYMDDEIVEADDSDEPKEPQSDS